MVERFVRVKWPLMSLAAAALAPATATANPRPLPFTYTHATQHAGALEVEQFVDAVPVRVAREGDTGTDAVTGLRFELQTELEYGLTDRLELGWYFVARQGASAATPALTFEGMKQRLRWRLADAGEWPVDVALYGEIAELRHEVELEQKLILSRRFGGVLLAANLWVEQEYYWQEEDWKFLYNPTAGVVFEVTPAVQLGLEYWARGRFDEDPAPETAPLGTPSASDVGLAATGPHHYLGPTLLLQGADVWTALGLYARLDSLTEAPPVGDEYGRLWVRLILGFDG